MILAPKLFTKNFQVGQFLFETYSAEITIEEGDNEAEAFAKAKQYTIQECLKNNPHLLNSDMPIIEKQQAKEETPIEAIANCKTLVDLEEFKILSTTDKAIEAAYRLQQLKLKNKQLCQ